MATILDFEFALKRRSAESHAARSECEGETELRRAAGKGTGKRSGKQSAKHQPSTRSRSRNVKGATAEIIFFTGVRYERM